MGLLKNSRQEYEVEAILAYDHDLEENGIVWAHSGIPNDLWVIGTSRKANILKSAGEGLPISIDPTFNHGAYEVTPVTYRHPFIGSKSKNLTGKWSDAILLGPTMIHHEKTEEVFDRGLRTIAHKTKTMNAKVGVITDGEITLINASTSNF
eukprot:Seg1178.5 transcript_id=Seg1178.5/GoldUCD/mRNA.D3Y31 product="hypothetical protein" protein_id=Seg1178.5/GoldUCD/D3Y31